MDKNLPISKYMRNYYKENGWDFTDAERATIYWNTYEMQQSEINNAIRKIADNTDDETLRVQINQRLEYDEFCLKMFRDNSAMDSVYVVKLYSDESRTEIFTSYEKAVDFALRFTAKANAGADKKDPVKYIAITKQKISDYFDIDCKNWYFGEWVSIDLEGSIVNYSVHQDCELRRIMSEMGRFENAYVYFHNPFDRGDIVRNELDDVGGSRTGVVAVTKEDWDKLEEEYRSGRYTDYYNTCTTVWFLLDNGEFLHDHPHICNLTKVDMAYDPRNLLCCAREILQENRGSSLDLDWFTYLMGEYRDEDERNKKEKEREREE